MTFRRLTLLLAGLLFLAGPAFAQSTFETGFGGLGGESDEPIEIESDELEVRDQEGLAIFIGNVVVVQGESRMKTAQLTVHYDTENQGTEEPAPAAQGPGGSQQISKLVATGGVVVTTKEQTATGNTGTVDMKTNMLELDGDVTLTQGQNVVNGNKLIVNLDTGHARVLSDSRVRVLLVPNSANQN